MESELVQTTASQQLHKKNHRIHWEMLANDIAMGAAQGVAELDLKTPVVVNC